MYVVRGHKYREALHVLCIVMNASLEMRMRNCRREFMTVPLLLLLLGYSRAPDDYCRRRTRRRVLAIRHHLQ